MPLCKTNRIDGDHLPICPAQANDGVNAEITQLTDAQTSIGLHVPKWLKFQGWVLDKAKKVEFSTGPDKTIKDKWLSYNPVGSSVKAEVVTVR